MELHRLETICEVVTTGLDRHGADRDAFAAYLREAHVTRVEVAEALEDVGRLERERAEASTALLHRALERLD